MARRRARRKQDNTGLIVMFLGVLGTLAVISAISESAAVGDFVKAVAIALGGVLVALIGLALWQPRYTFTVSRWAWRRMAGRKASVSTQAVRPTAPIAISRKPIPAGLRFAVLKRDGFRCSYCGRGESDGVTLHIDHLVPVAKGGRNEVDNLVTACQDCNLGKSATDLVGPNEAAATLV